jgi:hypothetical protein
VAWFSFGASFMCTHRSRFWLLLFLTALALGPSVGFAQIVLTEFMASNTQSLADEDGDYSDWMEVLNIAGTNVNLNGWALTDEPTDPRKWRFPAIDLGPGQSLVVFASDKNRRVPGSPLHANFRLSSSPDFLGLSNPGGTIVSDFGQAYPAQLPDISYGIVAEAEAITLLATNAPARVFFPVDDSLEPFWNLAEFVNDGWWAATNGLGFDRSSPAPTEAWQPAILASQPAIYFPMDQPGGVVITNLGSRAATENGTAVGGLTYNQPGIRPPESPGLPAANTALRFDGRADYITTGGSSLNDLAAFTISAWIRPLVLNRPRSGLWGQHGVVEFGFVDDSVVQLSSPASGTVQASYPFASNEWHHVATVGDGESLRIYLDGALVADGGSKVPFYGHSLYPLNLAGGGIFDPSGNFFNGFMDEFAMFGRALTDDEIASHFQATRDPNASFRAVLSSELSNALGNASIYARYEFTVPASDYSPLLLRLQHDDGFVAFLNGVEVARHNAPAKLAWNSVATSVRPGAVGLLWRDFDISAYSGLLNAGTNLLAIQLLNASADDSDLYLRAQIIGYQQTIQTNNYRYFIEATPGAINGIGQTNLGPLIIDVKHSPELPLDTDPILVTARLQPTFNPPASLSLTYRVMFGAEVNLNMFDDGQHGDGAAADGIYGATIPHTVSSRGQMVRWFLSAIDSAGLTSRWPPYRDIRNSPQYLGTAVADPSLTNPLPVLHWFVQSPSSADSTSGTRSSLFWNGVLYDNVFANVHGQSSQGFPKKSYNLDFNRGFKFQYSPAETAVEDINLLTTYPDKAHLRNILAYETFRDAGHAYHFVIPVRVQRNGAFFSDAHLVEDAEEEFLARVGLDPRGALYKMYNSLETANSGAEKKTRKFEGNNDLQRLLSGISLSGAARTAFIFDNIDLPAMANYLAALVITGNVDCCHKNYYLYRDSAGNGQWQFLPWDLDLSFGRNWTGGAAYFDDTMYISNGLFVGSNNRMLAALYATPAFRQMYLRRLRTLMEELMQPPGTPSTELKYEKRIRDLYELIGPDAALDFAKWPTWGSRQTMPQALSILTNQYFPGRRNYLFVNQRNAIPASITNDLQLTFGALEFNPPTSLQSQEYFTIVNTNSIAVDISGWRVANAVEHPFAPGTVIPAGGTLFLSPDVNAFRFRSTSPRGGETRFVQGNYSGQLSARGETLVLTDTNQRIVASLSYAGAPTPWQEHLRVSEIMYAPPSSQLPGTLTEDLEYVVLKNTGSSAVNLNGIRFDSGIDFTLGVDLFLGPAEQIYLAKNPEAFQQVYGTNFVLVGPYLGQLSNSGETVTLYDPLGEKVLDFTFDNAWFGAIEGRSLLVVADATPYNEYDSKRAWIPSAYPGGSAGIALAWETWRTQRFNPGDPRSAPDADPDEDGQSNRHEFTVGTDPLNPASYFHFTLAQGDGSVLVVRFPAAPGRQYTLLASHDLVRWIGISTTARGSESGIKSLSIDQPAAAPSAFYRVRISL